MRQTAIGIDCRLGGVRHGGIGRYIAEYLKLVVDEDSFRFSLVFSDPQQQQELLSGVSQKNLSRIQSTITDIRHYSISEQLRLPAIFNQLQVDLLHVPHFNVPVGYRRPFVVTIHDLLWHSTRGTTVTTLPAWQYWMKYGAYKYTVGSTVRRAARIFVPTQFVADTISDHYPHARNKTVVTYEGVGEQFIPSSLKNKISQQLLYVGSLYPHKNVSLILDALLQLKNYSLVIAGARDVFAQSFVKEIDRRGLQNRVSITGRVTDPELVKLYQTSGAVIQPSTSEGFGLTGVEALACHAPLLASDIPVFHEVYGDAALYFDPNSADSLVHVINQINQLTSEVNESARKHALAKCSWKRMTNSIVAELKAELQTHTT